ncbi:MAG: ribosome silencing factor [Myxococcales bacterium]|nr:ribosome silencing factor [Myxococcales bacterium]
MTETQKKNPHAAVKTPRPAREKNGADAKDVALWVASAALDKKAQDVEILDVRGKVDYTDFVVIASGRSDRQVSAIAKGVEESLKRDHGQRCYGVEGVQAGQWVLMDFGDVVVHVFHQDTRGYYDLEALWIDAARVDLPEGAARPDDDADRWRD